MMAEGVWVAVCNLAVLLLAAPFGIRWWLRGRRAIALAWTGWLGAWFAVPAAIALSIGPSDIGDHEQPFVGLMAVFILAILVTGVFVLVVLNARGGQPKANGPR